MNLLFAWRYFRSKKTTNAINIIAWIAVTAIAVGTASLIIILSVFNGFEELVKGLYSDFYASVKVVPAKQKTMHINAHQIQQIKAIKNIQAFDFVVEDKALLAGNAQTIVTIKGVGEQYNKVNSIAKYIRRGSFELGNLAHPAIVMGAGIENAVGSHISGISEELILYFPNKNAALTSSDGLYAFNVLPSGTFVIQQEFDNKYVFTNLPFLKYILGLDADEYSGIECRVSSSKERMVQQSLQQLLGSGVKVLTRYEQNPTLYAVMQMEKWVIYIILSLILIVAAFNMIGALTMLVLEKQQDIAVLKAMGANNQRIRNIFLLEGLLLAAIGTGAGFVIGTLICFLQDQFHILKLGGSTFIIDYYPIKSVLTDYLLIFITVTIIAFCAALVTARKASTEINTHRL